MVTSAPILDLYAPLSHKTPMSAKAGRGDLAPTWVPEDHRRRLTAYKVLISYGLNCSRYYLPSSVPEADRDKRREYGDADLLVDRIRAGVLGEDPEIVVEGADVDLPDEPDLPPEPKDPGPDANGVMRRVFEARMARWEEDANTAVDEWEQAWADKPALVERQEWLRNWAEDEGYWPKLHEGEGDTVELGDGLYALAWSTEKKRPILDVYDPGFYFPVITDQDRGFPRKVHVAWEFENDEGKRFVRRKTWELGPAPEVRTYPYASEPSSETCYFSDGTWELDSDVTRLGLDSLLDSKAEWAATEDGLPAQRIDLLCDFVPVVHVPNTPASRDHFGRSALLVVAQLLDDISMSDTDVQAAGELAAGPAVALAGGKTNDEKTTVRPGIVWNLPEGGRMDVLDLSAGLAELRALNEGLRDLLSINGRVPNAVLGRVDLTGNLAGVTLALSFSPFSQLIGAFRMTREPKHQLLLKMVQRIAQVGGVLDRGENPRARVAFGPFLPSDKSEVVDQVARLLEAGAISTQTAVQQLVASGYGIEDARGEVQRIRYEHPALAKDLADATGSEGDAADFLGIEPPEAPTAPTIELPGDET